MLSPSAELTMSSKVPQDVVDVVIDHLHADMKTLKTCSLVCNGWVPSSSWHLFSAFSWPPCTSRFGSLATCPKTPTGELRELVRILSSSNRLCTYIRRLRLGTHKCRDQETRASRTFSAQDFFEALDLLLSTGVDPHSLSFFLYFITPSGADQVESPRDAT